MVSFALAAFVPALVLTAVLVPWMRRWALKANLVAAVRPGRWHTEPRPYGGGLAMALAVALVVTVAWTVALRLGSETQPKWLPPAVAGHLETRTPMLMHLAIGALLFFVIGLLDDRYGLPAIPKLILQFGCAAVVVVGFGIQATLWFHGPYVPAVVSILWIVAVVNAYNLLDHMDGLASAVGLVALGSLALGQMPLGEWFVPGMALVVAGALAGFLIWNFPPAKLFMGNAGSLWIGYLLATLTIVAQYYKESAGSSQFAVLVPLAVLAVPLWDAACVVLARMTRGRSPLVGDATSHLGHRLMARGFSPRRVVLLGSLAAAVTGAASVLMYSVRGTELAVVWVLVGCVLLLVGLARSPRRTESAP